MFFSGENGSIFSAIFSCVGYDLTLHFLSFLPTACPPGTFKSMQGTGLCLQCPPNSRSTSEASTICVCRNGYYRADGDLPDMPCTSESKNIHIHIRMLLTKNKWVPGIPLAPDSSPGDKMFCLPLL